MLPDLHRGFSRDRSGGLVFPSLSEFSTVYCDPTYITSQKRLSAFQMLNSNMWLVATLWGSVEIIEWFLWNTVSWPVYLSVYIKKEKTVCRECSIIFIAISFRIKKHRHFLFILLKTVQELLCLGSRKYSFHI